jgi:hypothetical protein
MGAGIQAVVTGWVMVAAGTIIFDGALAFDVAQSEAYNKLRPIRQWELQRERDARAAEIRESEEQAKAEVDEKHDEENQRSVETPDGFVRICDLSPDAAKDKKLKEVIAGHEHLIGTDVALAGTPDVAVIRRQLAFEFPISAIDQVLQDLVGRVAVRLRPTLFVGQPGGGKSRFARPRRPARSGCMARRRQPGRWGCDRRDGAPLVQRRAVALISRDFAGPICQSNHDCGRA